MIDGFASIGTEPKRLTPAEKRVIDVLLRDCCSDAEISVSLQITENTVRRHFHSIYLKLGINSRTRLVVRLLRLRYRRKLAKLTAAQEGSSRA